MLEHAFRLQQSPPCFPVTFDQLGADDRVRASSTPGEPHEVAGLKVTPQLQRHSGDSYGYRFEHGGKSVVYSTDSEHKLEDRAETEAFATFFRDADLVIFDAMYSLAEAIWVKEDWGHSSNIVGVELCQMARAQAPGALPPRAGEQRRARSRALLKDARRLEELTRGDAGAQGLRGVRRPGDRSLSVRRGPRAVRAGLLAALCLLVASSRRRSSRAAQRALRQLPALLPRERASALRR